MLCVGLLAGDRTAAASVIKACAQLGVDTGQSTHQAEPDISIRPIEDEDPNSFACVIGVGDLAPTDRNLADVLLPDHGLLEAARDVWQHRLLPFANNIRTGTRAHRARHSWPDRRSADRRFIGRGGAVGDDAPLGTVTRTLRVT